MNALRFTQLLSKFYSNISGKITQVLCVTVNAFLYANFEYVLRKDFLQCSRTFEGNKFTYMSCANKMNLPPLVLLSIPSKTPFATINILVRKLKRLAFEIQKLF